MELSTTEIIRACGTRQLLLVEPDFVDTVWSNAVLLLEGGRKYWQEYTTLESIYCLLKSGKIQLWLMNDEVEFILAMLTEINIHPKFKELHLMWIGGEDLESGMELFSDYVELWAHRQGASRVRVTGRKAWTRKLLKSGYGIESYTMSKDISKMKEH